MAKKSNTKPVAKVTTASKPPTPKHSTKEKAAIAASLKLSKADYTKSEHHNVMPYEAARSFTKNPTSNPGFSTAKSKIGGTAKLKVTTGIAARQTTFLDQDESFMKDVVEASSVNEFNKIFKAHYGEKRIKHRGLGIIIEPQAIYPSVLDTTQNSLRYKMGDTTGGVQLKKFFQYFEVVE